MTPDEILDDLERRLSSADMTLRDLATTSMTEKSEARLTAKAEGVRLALGYLREYERN